jgi:23S rRNA pseudouridine1911/1915/1917 synthase
VGDPLYGASAHLHVGKAQLPALGRQFLHAAAIGLPHPRTGQWIEARAPLPADLLEFLQLLGKASHRDLAAVSSHLF